MASGYVQFGSNKRFHAAAGVYREKKEWGEEQWIVNKEYCGKKLVLRKNRRCSLHKHEKKDEVFYLLSGSVKMEIGDEVFTMKPGDFVHIPAGVYHRFSGLADSEIMEFSTNHQEEDSYRKEFSGHVDEPRFARQHSIVKHFAKARVLVLGDAMLDTYVSGDVARISPEAPIPVVRFKNRRHVPGGAANAAANIASVGGTATLISVRGNDATGKMLETLLKKHNVRSAFVTDANRSTTEKQRIVAGGLQQIVRLDFEETESVSPALQKKLLALLTRELKKHDALLLSDYAKGVFTPQMIKTCIAAAKKAKVPVIVDPKPQSSDYVAALKGATVITPNRQELHILSDSDRPASVTGLQIAKKTGASVLCTLGGEGMLLVSGGKSTTFPALASGVVDVSGAGDTVAATVALALAAGASLHDAVDLSNRAAAIVVEKAGTATASTDEFIRAL